MCKMNFLHCCHQKKVENFSKRRHISCLNYSKPCWQLERLRKRNLLSFETLYNAAMLILQHTNLDFASLILFCCEWVYSAVSVHYLLRVNFILLWVKFVLLWEQPSILESNIHLTEKSLMSFIISESSKLRLSPIVLRVQFRRCWKLFGRRLKV